MVIFSHGESIAGLRVEYAEQKNRYGILFPYLACFVICDSINLECVRVPVIDRVRINSNKRLAATAGTP